MTWILVCLGLLLVLLTLRDIFHTLWHPHGMGGVARQLFALTWRAGRRLLPDDSELAGPLALVVTAATWSAGLVVGFALVYLPHMPDGFSVTTPLSPERTEVWTSFYLSLVAVATLGLGDVTPVDPWLRMAVPAQALLGFLLFTAVISWVLQLYPALGRRRSLARLITTLGKADGATRVGEAQPAVAVALLEQLRSAVAMAETDLSEYGESYYFREADPGRSLAAQLPYLEDVVQAAVDSASPDVRWAGQMLGHQLEQVCRLLGREFLHLEDAERGVVLAAYRSDHQQDR